MLVGPSGHWRPATAVSFVPALMMPRGAVVVPAPAAPAFAPPTSFPEHPRQEFARKALYFFQHLQTQKERAAAAGIAPGRSWTRRYRAGDDAEEAPASPVLTWEQMQREDDDQGSVHDIWDCGASEASVAQDQPHRPTPGLHLSSAGIVDVAARAGARLALRVPSAAPVYAAAPYMVTVTPGPAPVPVPAVMATIAMPGAPLLPAPAQPARVFSHTRSRTHA